MNESTTPLIKKVEDTKAVTVRSPYWYFCNRFPGQGVTFIKNARGLPHHRQLDPIKARFESTFPELGWVG